MSRVALVIGGASGIGWATSVALAEHGLRIAVADLVPREAALQALSGQGHRAYALDVADETAIVSLFNRVESELGPVGVLVNCAGIIGYVDGRRPALWETSVDLWTQVFAVNALGAFLCVREMFRRRRDRPVEHGRIVLIGSMAAQDGGKNSPPAYVASKGAVHALVKAATHEAIALGMTVNCVAPGVIDTPLLRNAVPEERRTQAYASMPLARPGSPEEVAATIAFLVSPDASFICGACVDVNGGTRLT